MMNGFILQENTSILISRNGKTLYSILHRSLDLTLFSFIFIINVTGNLPLIIRRGKMFELLKIIGLSYLF